MIFSVAFECVEIVMIGMASKSCNSTIAGCTLHSAAMGATEDEEKKKR